MTQAQASALKEIFNAARLQHIADELAAIDPGFDKKKFLQLTLADLNNLSLMQRLRRTSESLYATLPVDYKPAIAILRQLAPRLNNGFVTLALPDYVGLYGHQDFDTSMAALKFFTAFGSSEFAIREFLKRDHKRTLAVMQSWSQDSSEQVRRLASEGSRPRLPWSFRLDALLADPELAAPILEQLKTDPSAYVRKSVANHLNDITKLHPDWVLARLQTWPLDKAPSAWIARHALRTLIKQGDKRALAVIGAGQKAAVTVRSFAVTPAALSLGQRLQLSLKLESTARTPQRLVVDYAIHYIKKSGRSSAKVFKLKELTLTPGQTLELSRSQLVKDFTTRVHHAGHHGVELIVNGEKLASGSFDLRC